MRRGAIRCLAAAAVLLIAGCDARAGIAGLRVIDGDTFDLVGERIRIENIDAPERGERARCGQERAWADEATAGLRSRVQAARAIRLHRKGYDRYGRTLALVDLDGRDVGAALIADGLAVEWGHGRPNWCGMTR